MKHSIGIFAGFAFFLLANTVQAQEEVGFDSGLYVSVHALGSNPKAHDDPTNVTFNMDYGYGGIAAVGYAVAYPKYVGGLRVELEASYRRQHLDDIDDPDMVYCAAATSCEATGDFIVAAIMANVILDIHTRTPWVPHIGAGYGRGRVYFNDWVLDGVAFGDSSTDADMYQVMVGIGYKISPGMIVDAEYRFFQPNNDGIDGYFSTEITIGLRLVL